jgi:hypothetical protein
MGMSKGCIILVHTRKLQQIYSRFTVHREAVEYVRYLPNAKTFVSVSTEQDFCIWKLNKEEKSIKHLCIFKIGRNLRFLKVL